MKITYFSDTDTAMLGFSEEKVDETLQVRDGIFLDLDAKGNLVSLTLDKVSSNADINKLTLPDTGKTVDLNLAPGK